MKKHVVYTICLLLACKTVFPQNRKIADSLFHLLAVAKQDSSRAMVLSDLSFLYVDAKPDSAFIFAQQALDLAKKKHFKKAEASALNRLGNVYRVLGEIPKSLNLIFKALQMSVDNKYPDVEADCLNNLGLVYMIEFSDDIRAISYFKSAIKISEQLNDSTNVAHLENNISRAYLRNNQVDSAYFYVEKAYRHLKVLHQADTHSLLFTQMGSTYFRMGKQREGIDLILKSIQINTPNNNHYFNSITYTRIAGFFNEMKQSDSSIFYARKGLDEAKIMDYKQGLFLASNLLAELYEPKDLKVAHYYLKIAKLENDTLYGPENVQNLQKIIFQEEQRVRQDEAREIARQHKVRLITLAAFLGGVILIAIILYRSYRQKIKANKELAEKNSIILTEKKRSDDLLLNILPAEVAEELKANGASKAKDFSEVTVLFTDFKNFTTMSEKLSAQELVNEINYCYSAFDNIITKYGIEKIKTIGDSYMCAGGLPVASKTNAEDTVRAAMELRDFVTTEIQKRKAANQPFFEIRIGCHTGPVVAGIVGIKKFAYDIWGDTVNIASRMESSGEPGKINISGNTYELVKEKFTCTHRGKIEAKNKGMIDMYFAEAQP